MLESCARCWGIREVCQCWGVDLSGRSLGSIRREKELNLSYLLDAYLNYPNKRKFFLKNRFIDKLAGTSTLRKQIASGMSESAIRKSWQKDLHQFRQIRKKYLLYP